MPFVGSHVMTMVRSRTWVCPHCRGSNLDLLPDPVDGPMIEAAAEKAAEAKPIGPPSVSEAAVTVPVVNLTPPAPDVASPAFVANVAEGAAVGMRPRRPRPPLLLDTAICFILVLVCGIVFRRMF
ncbi:hypothetical protein B0H10DRAFT_2009635 [Mycena sp. CBHHK59/15]|nr:hypothetical protein B0H10DRAFT_2009635 [Mycena sp. CBHHK59/15]